VGFDTTIIINNDMLSDIEKDTRFGAMVAHAIRALPGSNGPEPIGYGAYAIESHHMDGITVVAVGGRKGQVLGGCPYTDNVLEIIRNIAASHDLSVITNTQLADLNKAPTMKELQEWAEMRGHKLVKLPEEEEAPSEEEEQILDQIITTTYSGPDRRKTRIHTSNLDPHVIDQVKPWPVTEEQAQAWAKKNGLVLVAKEALEETGGKVEKAKKPSLDELRLLAKEKGWRLIRLVRKG
jgi:hypothetical protein